MESILPVCLTGLVCFLVGIAVGRLTSKSTGKSGGGDPVELSKVTVELPARKSGGTTLDRLTSGHFGNEEQPLTLAESIRRKLEDEQKKKNGED